MYPLEKKPPTSVYFISGIWMETNHVKHYAVHRFLDPGVSGAKKMSRDEVARLIQGGKTVFTWRWDYQLGRFNGHDRVWCGGDKTGNYLYVSPDNRHTLNLRHLINYNWIKC